MTPQVWALEKADEIMDSLADCENHGPTKLRVIAAALEEAVKAEREATPEHRAVPWERAQSERAE